VTKPDRASLEKWLASDYLYVHSNGSVLDRAGEIRDTMSTTWTGVKLDDLKARSYGDVVIITGAITLTGTSKGYVTGARRFTDIWVKRNGQWQIVGGQSTLVPAK
jgi:ketosteroid isomerase-like protein